jgi:hypothetical protein
MAEEVAIDLNIKTGEAEKNTQSLKGKLKQLKLELESLEEGSDAFNKIALEAAEAEDKLGDLSAKIKTLSSDTRKLDTVVGVAQGIAGGFAAAQGAAALFGVESEDLNKSLLKVQASLGLLNGVQAIAATLQQESAVMTGLNSAATAIYNFFVNASTGALNKFRVALAGTGIGLIIIAIGVLISYWDKLTSSTKASTKATEDDTKATEENKKKQAELGKALNAVSDIRDGKNKELLAKTVELNQQIEALQREADRTKIEIDKNTNAEVVKNLTIAHNDTLRKIQTLEDEKARIVKEAADKERAEKDKTAKEQGAKDDEKAKVKADAVTAEAERLLALQTQFNEAAAEDKADAEAKKKELEQAGRDEEKRISEEAAAAQIELDKKIEENELRHIAEVAAAKKKAIADGFGIATAAANALSSLNALITQSENQNRNKSAKERLALEKKQFERGKALAIVTTVINTSQAIMAQMGAGPVGIALAALAGITGAIQIATIASQKFDGGGGSISQVGNVGSVGAPEVGNQAPQVPQTPQSIPIPQQVYVTETDITGTQQQVNVIEGLSKIQ